MINLELIKRTDSDITSLMKIHYSKPLGFVGRNLCYRILFGGKTYGAIVGGSATLHLPNRESVFDFPIRENLNNIVNNIFYHITKTQKYPLRNFTTAVLLAFEKKVSADWKERYGDSVLGFESLVELPRTGDLYLKAGYTLVGQTKGFTCKRTSGSGTDDWSGKRVWNTKELRPKLVFCKRAP